MSRFRDCLAIIDSPNIEGGLSNHKRDRGGLTMRGITQRTYDGYRASRHLPPAPVSGITSAEVEDIYGEYWRDARCSYIPEPLDLLVFDMAINSGAGRAVKTLQEALGVDPDGIFGRQTINALHEEAVAEGIPWLCETYLQLRKDWYYDIVARRPDQGVFLAGWFNRLDHLREVIA